MDAPEGTPPTTRLTARGAATRSRIVQAAVDLMQVKGVAATTLDDVRAASNTSKSQLYHHFPDKTALVREVVSAQGTQLIGQEDQPRRLSSIRGLERWRDAIIQRAPSGTASTAVRSARSPPNWPTGTKKPACCSRSTSISGKNSWPTG